MNRGALRTPVLDGKEPDCVWHRLMLDACIPSDTAVKISTRWSNDIALLEYTEWVSEPSPYLRRNGSEIRFCTNKARQAWAGRGHWNCCSSMRAGVICKS